MNLQMLSDSKILTGVITVSLISYLIGSLSFAVIFSKLLKKDDVRKYGSGNAGMTNMLRTFGKLPAALTAICDFAKGIISALLGRFIFSSILGITDFDPTYFCCFFALIGHLFPIFFKFKGGKGVLTAFGCVLLLNPLIFGILFVIYVPMAFITRIVSLASLLGMISYPIFTFIQIKITGGADYSPAIWGVILITLPVIAHHENIKRLLTGTERKFGSSSAK